MEDNKFNFGENNEDMNTNEFDYNSISGLGESNYENEDLFTVDPVGNYNSDNGVINNENNNYSPLKDDYDIDSNDINDYYDDFNFGDENNQTEEKDQVEENNEIEEKNNTDENTENKDEKSYNDVDNDMEEAKIDDIDDSKEDEIVEENSESSDDSESIIDNLNAKEISETPIDELDKLTEYKEEKIANTDIKTLFDRVSLNVKDASEIFKKNSEMKEKIDSRFEELKKLQAELENAKSKQIDEVNQYKDEVLEKLTAKKDEIEKRLNLLKDLQANLEKEKADFEQYRKEEQEKISQIEKDVQAAYDERREELGRIEDTLREQKDSLDEQRNQLSLDKIQYEADKNELANNLLKFNELVDTFTNGVNNVKPE